MKKSGYLPNAGYRDTILPEKPYTDPPLKKGEKKPLLRRSPVLPGRQEVAFTGRGFIPDYMSEHAYTTFPLANTTKLENEGVLGTSSMMPPSGLTRPPHLGQATDEGSGGAGSFATITAFQAKG